MLMELLRFYLLNVLNLDVLGFEERFLLEDSDSNQMMIGGDDVPVEDSGHGFWIAGVDVIETGIDTSFLEPCVVLDHLTPT